MGRRSVCAPRKADAGWGMAGSRFRVAGCAFQMVGSGWRVVRVGGAGEGERRKL